MPITVAALSNTTLSSLSSPPSHLKYLPLQRNQQYESNININNINDNINDNINNNNEAILVVVDYADDKLEISPLLPFITSIPQALKNQTFLAVKGIKELDKLRNYPDVIKFSTNQRLYLWDQYVVNPMKLDPLIYICKDMETRLLGDQIKNSPSPSLPSPAPPPPPKSLLRYLLPLFLLLLIGLGLYFIPQGLSHLSDCAHEWEQATLLRTVSVHSQSYNLLEDKITKMNEDLVMLIDQETITSSLISHLNTAVSKLNQQVKYLNNTDEEFRKELEPLISNKTAELSKSYADLEFSTNRYAKLIEEIATKKDEAKLLLQQSDNTQKELCEAMEGLDEENKKNLTKLVKECKEKFGENFAEKDKEEKQEEIQTDVEKEERGVKRGGQEKKQKVFEKKEREGGVTIKTEV